MEPKTDSPPGAVTPLMRPIEREILLASSRELSVARRCVLWARLRLDPDARAYAAAERMVQDAVGSSADSRRPIRYAALVPLAAAAALALAVGLWSLRSTPTRSPGHTHRTAVGQVLETPLISRTRQLAIEAERLPRAPSMIRLASAEPRKQLGLTSPPAPTWSSHQRGVSANDVQK